MATMIQIRNVPEDVHRKAKARAALAGMTLSEFILRELQKILERPPREELLARISKLAEPRLDPEPADLIRLEREAR